VPTASAPAAAASLTKNQRKALRRKAKQQKKHAPSDPTSKESTVKDSSDTLFDDDDDDLSVAGRVALKNKKQKALGVEAEQSSVAAADEEPSDEEADIGKEANDDNEGAVDNEPDPDLSPDEEDEETDGDEDNEPDPDLSAVEEASNEETDGDEETEADETVDDANQDHPIDESSPTPQADGPPVLSFPDGHLFQAISLGDIVPIVAHISNDICGAGPNERPFHVLPLYHVLQHVFPYQPLLDLAQMFSCQRLGKALHSPYIGNGFMIVFFPCGIKPTDVPAFKIPFSCEHVDDVQWESSSSTNFFDAAVNFLRTPFRNQTIDEGPHIRKSLVNNTSVFILGPYRSMNKTAKKSKKKPVTTTYLRFLGGISATIVPNSAGTGKKVLVEWLYSAREGCHGESPWAGEDHPLKLVRFTDQSTPEVIKKLHTSNRSCRVGTFLLVVLQHLTQSTEANPSIPTMQPRLAKALFTSRQICACSTVKSLIETGISLLDNSACPVCTEKPRPPKM
jgi:hypothetical protein